MDYLRQPVGALIRGPLLRTPQGLVVLLFTTVYLVAAALCEFWGIVPWAGWSPERFTTLCLGWPVILFVFFVRDNQPCFLPSWSNSAWLCLCGAAPLAFVLFGLWER